MPARLETLHIACDVDIPQGLRKIRETGQSIGVPIKVFGPETHITAVVPMALGIVDGSSAPEFDEVPEQVTRHKRVGVLVYFWPLW